jgi:nucleoside-diphosphate-sugar epimerase
MNVLVTGANGFVGSALVARLARDARFAVRAAVRRAAVAVPAGVDRTVADLTVHRDWGGALEGIEAVVHLAARVHVIHEIASDPLAEFRRVNVHGTLNLARQAAASGVRRFVYLSSVKVNGESGTYVETDPPAPEEAYGVSKLEAESALRALAGDTGLEVVIIRAPLVYGPGVRANFDALRRAVARGLPLPLAAIHNRRSMVAIDNLVDFIVTCIVHPGAPGEVFFVSDGEDLSTPDLIRRLARAMGRPARLLWLPPALVMLAAAACGRRDAAQRLLGSLQVDIGKARSVLAWSPPIGVDEGLARTARTNR